MPSKNRVHMPECLLQPDPRVPTHQVPGHRLVREHVHEARVHGVPDVLAVAGAILHEGDVVAGEQVQVRRALLLLWLSSKYGSLVLLICFATCMPSRYIFSTSSFVP